jgi:tetratricopeptide (TPR) repeat protein
MMSDNAVLQPVFARARAFFQNKGISCTTVISMGAALAVMTGLIDLSGSRGEKQPEAQYESAIARNACARDERLSAGESDDARLYHDQGSVFDDQGDYGKALEGYRKALGIVEKVLGKDHPSTATIYNNIAGGYYKQGQYAEALEELLKAYRIRIRKLGEAHPDTQNTRRGMERVYPKTRNPKPFPEWLADALRRPDA